MSFHVAFYFILQDEIIFHSTKRSQSKIHFSPMTWYGCGPRALHAQVEPPSVPKVNQSDRGKLL
jgi:hypothetical protein